MKLKNYEIGPFEAPIEEPSRQNRSLNKVQTTSEEEGGALPGLVSGRQARLAASNVKYCVFPENVAARQKEVSINLA